MYNRVYNTITKYNVTNVILLNLTFVLEYVVLQLNLMILVLKYVQNAIKIYKTLAGAPPHACTCCSYPPTPPPP